MRVWPTSRRSLRAHRFGTPFVSFRHILQISLASRLMASHGRQMADLAFMRSDENPKIKGLRSPTSHSHGDPARTPNEERLVFSLL